MRYSEQSGDGVAGRANRIVTGAIVGLAAVAAIGVWLVFQFVGSERERDLQNWQVRMAIVADGRAASV